MHVGMQACMYVGKYVCTHKCMYVRTYVHMYVMGTACVLLRTLGQYPAFGKTRVPQHTSRGLLISVVRNCRGAFSVLTMSCRIYTSAKLTTEDLP